MAILLLRHTSAGHRRTWGGPDHLRPLDEQGRREAEVLAGLYAPYAVERVLTSPYTRCRQSVEPLARDLGLRVEERIELAEGATRAETLALVDEVSGQSAVLCTHGDIVAELLGEESLKGSTWVLEPGPEGNFTRLEYLPPPT
jgi:8-oxo-dGTP diphosphatase